MRPCPTCGATRRRELAPAFYECLAPAGAPGDLGLGQGVCGTHYMDSDSRPRAAWLSALFGG